MRRDRRFIAKVAALVLAVAAIVVPVTMATAAPGEDLHAHDVSLVDPGRSHQRDRHRDVPERHPFGQLHHQLAEAGRDRRTRRDDHQRHRHRHGGRGGRRSLGLDHGRPAGEARQDLRADDEAHDTRADLVLGHEHHLERFRVDRQLLQRRHVPLRRRQFERQHLGRRQLRPPVRARSSAGRRAPRKNDHQRRWRP